MKTPVSISRRPIPPRPCRFYTSTATVTVTVTTSSDRLMMPETVIESGMIDVHPSDVPTVIAMAIAGSSYHPLQPFPHPPLPVHSLLLETWARHPACPRLLQAGPEQPARKCILSVACDRPTRTSRVQTVPGLAKISQSRQTGLLHPIATTRAHRATTSVLRLL